MGKEILLPSYYASARLITEYITLEDEKRKVTYLNPFAEDQAPNIADHIVGAVLIGKALGQLAKKNKKYIDQHVLDAYILWHDAPETRYGDISRDRRKYVSINEDKARIDMFGSLPWGEEIISLIERFEAGGEDIHVKLARDADALYVICTIKEFLDKKIAINKPDERIAKTLKRLSTDEGFYLGQQIANSPSKMLWQTIAKIAGFDTKNLSLPQSLMTTMGIGWMLYELAKKEGIKNLDRGEIIDLIFTKSVNGSSLTSSYAIDARVIYTLLEGKRLELKGKKRVNDASQLLKKLQTKEGKKLGEIIITTDPFDWWQLLNGYAEVNSDGSLRMLPR